MTWLGAFFKGMFLLVVVVGLGMFAFIFGSKR